MGNFPGGRKYPMVLCLPQVVLYECQILYHMSHLILRGRQIRLNRGWTIDGRF